MDSSFDETRFRDACMDIFFKIQGAWTNRDLSSIRNLFTDEMYGTMQSDVERMRQEKRINKLDNIAVRSVDITEVWQESGRDKAFGQGVRRRMPAYDRLKRIKHDGDTSYAFQSGEQEGIIA